MIFMATYNNSLIILGALPALGPLPVVDCPKPRYIRSRFSCSGCGNLHLPPGGHTLHIRVLRVGCYIFTRWKVYQNSVEYLIYLVNFYSQKVIMPSVWTPPCGLFSGLLPWTNNCWGHLSEGMWDQEQWNIMMIQITDITISHRWDSEWAVFWFNNWQCSCSLWTSFRCGEGAPTPVKQNIQT